MNKLLHHSIGHSIGAGSDVCLPFQRGAAFPRWIRWLPAIAETSPKHIALALAGLFIGGLSAGAQAATATGGANSSLVPTIQTNVNVPVNVQVPVNVLGTQQVTLVNNQNTNQANQNAVGNAAGTGTGSTTMGGANNSVAPTIQTNINAPVNIQVPVNVGGNQQTTLVNNQNTNQANQNAVGDAAGASGTGPSGSFVGNQLWQTQYSPTYFPSFF